MKLRTDAEDPQGVRHLASGGGTTELVGGEHAEARRRRRETAGRMRKEAMV